jgi:hypothetical protein
MDTDWNVIRLRYEAAVPVFQIAADFKVTPREIQQRAAAECWRTPPTVRERATAALSQTSDPVADVVRIKKLHREEAAKLRELSNTMRASLERIACGDSLAVRDGDLSVLSTGRGGNVQGSIDALSRLAEAQAKIVALERQAYDLDDQTTPNPEQIRSMIELAKAEVSRRTVK